MEVINRVLKPWNIGFQILEGEQQAHFAVLRAMLEGAQQSLDLMAGCLNRQAVPRIPPAYGPYI